MNVPTEADWRSEEWYRETEHAYENFRGKTTQEAVRLLEKNALYYQEDVMFMPSRVFGYYLVAYIAYLMSEAARQDPDGASSFISLIQVKAEHQPQDLLPLWPEIEPLLRTLAEHQADFDADWFCYGSFRARIHEIVERGFPVSFDTKIPEVVPADVTLRRMGARMAGPVSVPVAIQVFRNSAIDPIDVGSSRSDILRIFGPPDAVGGGDHPQFGRIPDFIRYDRPDCGLYFRFEEDILSTVMFLPRERTR